MHPLVQNKNPLIESQDVSPASLQHGDLGAIMVEILGNVMATVASPHHDYILALDIVAGRVFMLASMIDIPFEIALARE